jgi:hypothetical protein
MSPKATKRQECEVYSRVTGYLRPVKNWNDGKKAEYMDRVVFKVDKMLKEWYYKIMSERIRCYPPKDFFVAFLATRNVNIVEDKEQILHYFGSSFKELKSLIKADKPDLVVINSTDLEINEEDLQFCNYVVDPVSSDKDIYQNATVRTNNARLCQIYYRKLDLQRRMTIFYREIEPTSSSRASDYLNRFIKFMHWA